VTELKHDPAAPTAELDKPGPRPRIAVWLGSAAPTRSVRWLDGAIKTAATMPNAIAIAAGDPVWLDLAADRATLLNLPCAGIATSLQLDYLGWAQVAAAAARQLNVASLLVDEASRPERFPEVAAIAEVLGIAQLTHVVQLALVDNVFEATRVAGDRVQTLRVRPPAVIGVRIAESPVDEYPTPRPATAMQRLDLELLGLDPAVLGHRERRQPSPAERKTVERIAEHLAVHARPRAT
jgi:electron transfer flavoprotein alpha/beta subunit